MLDRKCRPRPHFIAYQRVMIQFFFEDKTSHGYEEWLEGYLKILNSEKTNIGVIAQLLSLTSSLLVENVFYSTNTITWKVSTPSFQFRTDESMRVLFDDVTVACYFGEA